MQQSALDGNLQEVSRLLKESANPHAKRAESGETALILAAKKGYLEVLKELLPVSNPEHDGLWGRAFDVAVEKQHFACARYLAPYTDINKENIHGKTPLIESVIWQKEPCVDFLLALGADANRVEGICQRTPLMVAAHHGYNTHILNALLPHSNINAQDNQGNTALGLALSKKLIGMKPDETWIAQRKKTIELLTLAGSNMEIQNHHGETPLCIALKSGQYIEHIESLCTVQNVNLIQDDKPMLMHALALKNDHVIRVLLNSGANPNQTTKDSHYHQNTLHQAMTMRDDAWLEKVLELLEGKIDINAALRINSEYATAYKAERKDTQFDGVTPLILSQTLNLPLEIVKKILDMGADPCKKSAMGTALDVAIENKSLGSVLLILKHLDGDRSIDLAAILQSSAAIEVPEIATAIQIALERRVLQDSLDLNPSDSEKSRPSKRL